MKRPQHSSSKVRAGVFQALANGSLASDVRAPSHCVRSCLWDLENTASRCGLAPILLVLFVPVPVGRINCLLDLSSTWLSFLWLFRSVFGSCPSCSAHLTQRRFDVQVGKMLRRLPHSVSKNHGRRVLKCFNTLNDLIVWCLFCWRTSGTEHRRRGQDPKMGSTRHFI